MVTGQYLCCQPTYSLWAQGAAEIHDKVGMHCTSRMYKRIAGEGIITPELKCPLMSSVIPGTNTSMDTAGKILLGFTLALYFLAMRLFSLYSYCLLIHLAGKREKSGMVAPIIVIYHSNPE